MLNETKLHPPPDLGSDSRKSPRFHLVLPALIDASGASMEVLVLDMSPNGCLIESEGNFAVEEVVSLTFAGRETESFDAHVMWSDGSLAGCCFKEALPDAVVKQARLRGSPFFHTNNPVGESLETLGAMISMARRQAHLSATELAKRAGISRPTLWSWETGRRRPSEANLTKLNEVLAEEGVLASQLSTCSEGRENSSIAQVVERYRDAIAFELELSREQVRISLDFG